MSEKQQTGGFGALAASMAAAKPAVKIDGERPRSAEFLVGVEDEVDGMENETPLEPHRILCQMNELDASQADAEWRQTARWIKFEEDVEEGGARWSKPRVASLNLHSLLQLRNAFADGELILNCEAETIESIFEFVTDRLVMKRRLQDEYRDALMELLVRKHWSLHEKRMVRSSSYILGAKLRGLGDKKPSARDLEKADSAPSNPTLKPPGMAGQDAGDFKYDQSFLRKVPPGAEAANVLVGGADFLEATVAVFVRLRHPTLLQELTEVPVPTRFLFLLLAPTAAPAKSDREMGRCMGTLMSDEVFHEVAYLARSKEGLLTGIDEFLKYCVVLPPNEWDPNIRLEPPSAVPSQQPRRLASSANFAALAPAEDTLPTSSKAPPAQPQAEAASESVGHSDPALERTGRLFGGLVNDVKRKAPFYRKDFTDALHVQTIGVFFFMYFACLTPIITFGGLLTDATEGYLGAMESILSGAICGISFSLLAGQPLNILGSTGPVLIFETIVYRMCKELQWDYLAFRMWIGLWMCLVLLVFVAFDLSALVKYITRFTEESFAALIAMIFIVEALRKQLSISTHYPVSNRWTPQLEPDLDCRCRLRPEVNETERRPLVPGQQHLMPSFPLSENGSVRYFVNFSALEYFDWDSVKTRKLCTANQGEWTGSGCGTFAVPDVFFFSCILFVATFSIGYGLKAARTSRFFPNRVRAVVSDFAIMIAIVSMTCVDLAFGLHTPKLQVPSKFSPTLGYDTRGWLVTPFGPRQQNPWYTAVLALLPALLATILIFMDQQITAVIVNRKENQMKKGVGYHLDLLIVAVLIGINSVLGIPWFVAATVLAINHVMALKIESESAAPGEKPTFEGCRENRLSGVLVFTLVGLSVFLTPVLKHIPMPVLYGVFLYMGVSTLRGVQLAQRICIIFMPQKYQPDYKYLRHVRIGQVHKFTIIQVACLALLWVVKAVKQISILFPIMVLAMCFIRKMLDCLFSQEELRWLDDVMPPFSLRANSGTDGRQKTEKQPEASASPTQTDESQGLLGKQAQPEIFVQSPSGRNSPNPIG